MGAFKLAKEFPSDKPRRWEDLSEEEALALLCEEFSLSPSGYPLAQTFFAQARLREEERYLYAGYLRGMITKETNDMRARGGLDAASYALIEWRVVNASWNKRCRALLAIRGVIEK